MLAYNGDVTLKGTVALALALASISGPARAATRMSLTNGLVGDGALVVPIDDFGVYGSLVQSGSDDFQPAASINERPTFLAGLIVHVRTPDSNTTTAVLSDAQQWHLAAEGGGQDGIIGTHDPVVREILAGLSVSGGQASSRFSVSSSGNFGLQFSLAQRLTVGTPTTTSVLEQAYDITNGGVTTVEVVIHAVWEGDLYYNDPSPVDDVAGAVPGLCGVYLRDPGSTTRAITLADGPLSTVPMTYYFAGNSGDTPGSGPTIETINGSNQPIFESAEGGMPTSWRNYVSGVGLGMAGDNETDVNGDATMGIEYRFSLAPGATETIHIRRQYGSTAVTCNTPPPDTCGNQMIDGDEPCDGMDTPTCNGGTCLPSMCGDGYINEMAGETCEELTDTADCDALACAAPVCGDGYANAAAGEVCDDGIETAECNADCTPAMCGDGHINAAAGEECELSALCDTITCTHSYRLGGGCAGCTTGSPHSCALALCVLALIGRRRRRARAA